MKLVTYQREGAQRTGVLVEGDRKIDELEAEAPQREEEIARIDAEAKRTGEALDRYFRAFHARTGSAAGRPAGRAARLTSALLRRR